MEKHSINSLQYVFRYLLLINPSIDRPTDRPFIVGSQEGNAFFSLASLVSIFPLPISFIFSSLNSVALTLCVNAHFNRQYRACRMCVVCVPYNFIIINFRRPRAKEMHPYLFFYAFQSIYLLCLPITWCPDGSIDRWLSAYVWFRGMHLSAASLASSSHVLNMEFSSWEEKNSSSDRTEVVDQLCQRREKQRKQRERRITFPMRDCLSLLSFVLCLWCVEEHDVIAGNLLVVCHSEAHKKCNIVFIHSALQYVLVDRRWVVSMLWFHFFLLSDLGRKADGFITSNR